MSVTHHDIKFSQLSRYIGGLVKEKAEKTKRFVRELNPGIKSKLIHFNSKFIAKL